MSCHLQTVTVLHLFFQFGFLFFFFFPIAVTRTSNAVLNNSGESGHPCLVSDLRGNAFSFHCRVWCGLGFPGGSEIKNLPANAGDMGLTPGSGRFTGEENGYPLQYSCLGNSMDRWAWWDTVHGVTKSWTWLSDSNGVGCGFVVCGPYYVEVCSLYGLPW